MLDIATSYRCMQLEKMAKNLVLGLILAHLALIPAANFFSKQTDRQGQVDKSDFIGHYPTNVEHPKRFLGKDTSHNDHYTLAGKG